MIKYFKLNYFRFNANTIERELLISFTFKDYYIDDLVNMINLVLNYDKNKEEALLKLKEIEEELLKNGVFEVKKYSIDFTPFIKELRLEEIMEGLDND